MSISTVTCSNFKAVNLHPQHSTVHFSGFVYSGGCTGMHVPDALERCHDNPEIVAEIKASAATCLSWYVRFSQRHFCHPHLYIVIPDTLGSVETVDLF
jgi:hypothetical protein